MRVCAALTYVMASARGCGMGGSEAGGGEEQSDELMLHCSSSVHTLHLVLF